VGQLQELRRQLAEITVVKLDEKDEAIIEKLLGDENDEPDMYVPYLFIYLFLFWR
jgi:hypothetical protein